MSQREKEGKDLYYSVVVTVPRAFSQLLCSVTVKIAEKVIKCTMQKGDAWWWGCLLDLFNTAFHAFIINKRLVSGFGMGMK